MYMNAIINILIVFREGAKMYELFEIIEFFKQLPKRLFRTERIAYRKGCVITVVLNNRV